MFQSEGGSALLAFKENRYGIYRDARFKVNFEMKGSFMRPSEAGMIDEDKALYQRLLMAHQAVPNETLFDNEYFDKFISSLSEQSKARLWVYLHPFIVPSVESLHILEHDEFAGLREGYDDPWDKSIPFYGISNHCPRPARTFGFKWSTFTEQQRQKLLIEPTEPSYYTAREDIYFPFLTAEIVGPDEVLGIADKINVHCLATAMRGVVELFRKVNRAHLVHRRVLGFSIFHNDSQVRIHAHYPEIDGDKTTFWRDTLKEFNIASDEGKVKWDTYQFTLNVCRYFAANLFQKLKGAIEKLPEPGPPSVDDVSLNNIQNDADDWLLGK